MTGEITLTGQVLPIGGVKEKVLAANRAGIHNVVLPKLNEDGLADLPPGLAEELRITLADRIEQVLEVALGADGKPAAKRSRRKAVSAEARPARGG
jgi:ATP-dependent Lon protease